MQTIHITKKTDKDGILSLRLDLGRPDLECQVVVTVAQPSAQHTETRAWPSGYFETTFGSITDETFERAP